METGVIENKDQLNRANRNILPSPHLQIKIFNHDVWALLDTGSQITAVSDTFYNKLIEGNQISELPVTNMVVSTAIGKKGTVIKRQILLEFHIGKYVNIHTFLVIPHLSSEIILGNDWCCKNGLVIDYYERNIRLQKVVIPTSLMRFEGNSSDKIILSKSKETTYIYIIKINELSINLVDEIINDYDNEILNINKNACEIKCDNNGNSEHNNNSNKNITNMSKQNNTTLSEDFHSIACTLTALDEKQKQIFVDLMNDYESVFRERPGGARGYEHIIRINNNKSIARKSYPVPFALREQVASEIQSMLQAGIIERANSAYCNPLRIVKKEDGKIRICLDARFLNNITEDDHESPPLITDIVQKFYKAKYYTKLDLSHAYWQVPLHPDSRQYTAFVFDSTMYQFCRIPFGIKTAGSGFIRALKVALGNVEIKELAIYIDDLLIGTDSFERHMYVLKELFTKLQKYNFMLKLQKCEFFKQSITFLGINITEKGASPNQDKINDIINFDQPKTQQQLQSFLGVCNFYRRFVIRHNDFITPFRDLLKKNAKWEWTSKHDAAFKALKKNFEQSVCLSHVIPGAKFKIQTDASDLGICGILYQTDENGDHCLISLASRCLAPAEVNYTTTEKELLAIVYAVTKFREYLIGTHFDIITDHKGLTFLATTIYQNGRLIRWNLLLQQYSFSVVYCRGVDNVAADFFSRNPDGKFSKQTENMITIATLNEHLFPEYNKGEVSSLIIIALIQDDASLKNIMGNLSQNQKRDDKIKNICDNVNNLQDYQIYNDVLFHCEKEKSNWRIVIPDNLTQKLIDFTHAKLGHPGVFKTVNYLKKFYYWKKMQTQTKQVIKKCDLCQRVKYLSIVMEGEYQLVASDHPNDLVTVDFFGPLPRARGGMQYLLVVLDAFSKLVRLYPLRRATTDISLKKILDKYIPECGKMSRILSDNGTQFASARWKNRLELEGIKVLYSSVRHPQSNPTERVMREIGRFFRTFCEAKHTNWIQYVPKIEKLLNIMTHFSTGYSPHELHFNEPIQDEILKLFPFPDNESPSREYMIHLAKRNIEKNFRNRKKQQKISRIVLNLGDLVLLRVRHLSNALDKVTHKFFHLFKGPYKISEIIDKNAYKLVDIDDAEKVVGVYNRANLRKYISG